MMAIKSHEFVYGTAYNKEPILTSVTVFTFNHMHSLKTAVDNHVNLYAEINILSFCQLN